MFTFYFLIKFDLFHFGLQFHQRKEYLLVLIFKVFREIIQTLELWIYLSYQFMKKMFV
jgi:hypothetical protein